MIENGVGHGPKIELKLHQPQAQVSIAIALVEHCLLAVNCPAFDEYARAEHAPNQRSSAVSVFQLDVMTGIAFMNRENLQHVVVVFLQKALHARGVPIGRRWAYGVNARGQRIERWRVVQIGERIATAEFRHLYDLTPVRFRQAQNIVLADEDFDPVHRRACIGQQLFGPAMLLADGRDHPGDRHSPAFGIVRRQRLLREVPAPKLPCHDVHVPDDSVVFRLRVGYHLICAHAGVQHQL